MKFCVFLVVEYFLSFRTEAVREKVPSATDEIQRRESADKSSDITPLLNKLISELENMKGQILHEMPEQLAMQAEEIKKLRDDVKGIDKDVKGIDNYAKGIDMKVTDGFKDVKEELKEIKKSANHSNSACNDNPYLRKIESSVATVANRTKEISEDLQTHDHRLQTLTVSDVCRNNIGVCDCSTIKTNGYMTSGVYRIYVDHLEKRYYADVYCDMTTGNGGWTIFQRRKDGSVDFFRGWSDYENGFGNPNGELWLVPGQSTVSSSADSVVEACEGLQRRLEEHDYRLETMNQNIRSLSSAFDEIKVKLIDDPQSTSIPDHCRGTTAVCDCSDIKANGYTTSGVYRIYFADQGQRYYANASCDMTTTNDAWTVFQRRNDGRVYFYRDWKEYENGFGDPSGEFWLGNKFIHLLTLKRRYRLRIDLEDFEREKRYAEYSSFTISSSVDKYRLRIGTYSGTAGDSLTYHNGQRFSTKDNDNDAWTEGNRAVRYHAAWWYPNGHFSNLNGLYLRGPYTVISCSPTCYEGIAWHGWHGWAYSLKTTEMKSLLFNSAKEIASDIKQIH